MSAEALKIGIPKLPELDKEAVKAVRSFLPGKLLTRDQLLLLARDNVATPGVPGLTQLGIVPTPVDLVVPAYLQSYRHGSLRSQPDMVAANGTDMDLSTQESA